MSRDVQVLGDDHSLVPWYEDDKIKVHFEHYKDAIFVHCDVKKKSHSAIRALKRKGPELSQYLLDNNITNVWGYTQNEYIERTFDDWVYIQDFDHEGERFKLYEWVLKQ